MSAAYVIPFSNSIIVYLLENIKTINKQTKKAHSSHDCSHESPALNYELAVRVGKLASRQLSPEMSAEINTIEPAEIYEYIKERIPDIDETACAIRGIFLKELKEKRRAVLVEDTPI